MTRANEWHRLLDAPLKEVHSCLHPCASMPEGPAEPVVCRAADRMMLAFKFLKMTGCASVGIAWTTQLVWTLLWDVFELGLP